MNKYNVAEQRRTFIMAMTINREDEVKIFKKRNWKRITENLTIQLLLISLAGLIGKELAIKIWTMFN